MTRFFVLLLAVVFLSSCAAVRPEESELIRGTLPDEAIAAKTATPVGEEGYDDPDDVLSILALSGGGAYGAYGVGVMTGWTETGLRPEFDVVTGVSTGALISVFAFLGEEYDSLLEELYTTVSNADIFIDKGVKGILSDSLFDYTPFKEQIERVVTEELLAKVAAEHAKGRRLYVATTNLDSAELVVWDMGDIASGGRTDPLLHFRKVLRASAAVPIFFEPVYIKPQRGIQLRQAHVDGGLKAAVLVNDFLFRSDTQKKRLYVVINDSLQESSASGAIEANIPSIAQKSLKTILRTNVVQAVHRAYVTSVQADAEFFLAYVPDRLNDSVGSLDFDPVVMQALFDAGREDALSGYGWKHLPPEVEPLDRQLQRADESN